MEFDAYYEVSHKCPACRTPLEHFSTNDDPSALGAGGFAVCKVCGHIYWVNLARLEIRNLSKEEKGKLAGAFKEGNEMARAIRAYQSEVCRRVCPND